MPVEFLSDEEASAYGVYRGVPSQPDLERLFFLDDADRQLIAKRRGAHNPLGFALLQTTVRYLGVFLPDPLNVPDGVVEYLAGQLEIPDPGCIKRYTERRTTRFEHADEIRAACGLREFDRAEKELREWVDARAWTTGDGPKAVFGDAVRWLRERDVLLPGVTVLARLVAQVREEAYRWLWDTLHGMLTGEQRRLLDSLAVVGEGERFSPLERWRRGPAKASGLNMVKALDRVSQITGTGLGHLDLESAVPAGRLTELARYAMTASAAQIRRHPPARRLAAAGQLRAEGYPGRGEDLARLSPFVRHHLGVHGRYSFVLPDLAGGIRPLRDPGAEGDDRE